MYREVIRESREHKELNYLVIVPEQFTLQTQRDLVTMHPDGGILNIDVLSFARLSYRIFEEVGFSRSPGLLIDDMGKNLILRHLASEQEKNLKVIGKNLKKLGYITEVKSVISEFMQYGIDDNAIASLIGLCKENNRRLLSEKLEDISTLYHAFRDHIREKYTTSEELLVRVSEVLGESEKLSHSVIVLDGFTGFTPVQYDLIRALLQKCVDVHVTVLIDTGCDLNLPYDEQELFFLSRETIRELKHIAEEVQVPVLPDHVIKEPVPYRFRNEGRRPEMLIHLEKNLFRESGRPCDKISDDIEILHAQNPQDELSFVAVKIEELVRTKGCRYKDIAIVSNDPDTYMRVSSRVLSEYNIPFFIDRKLPVLQNPFIEYLRSIMRILTENFSHDGMFSYLKSSMTDIGTEDVDLLENYCIACGIRSKKQWMKPFGRRPDFITEEQLPVLDALRRRIVEPFSLFDNAATVKDYCTALFMMLRGCNAQQKLLAYQKEFLEKGLDVKAKEYDLVYPAVLQLLDKLVELLGDEEMDAESFYELLDAGFSELRVGAIPSKTDYVQIGDLTRSRFRKIKALFFVGVNEGIIPQAASVGGIISDLDREFFLDHHADVQLAPSSRRQAYTQRLYLYMAMTKPAAQLYLSFSGVSAGGTSMLPSYLITELKNMFPKIRVSSFDRLSLLDKVYTEETAFTGLAGDLQGLIRGNPAPETLKLFEYFANNTQFSGRLETMINRAFLSAAGQLTDTVGAQIAHVIYGNEIVGSVTRLETYAKCAYEHFLHYGLDLKERVEFNFAPSDMGSVFHNALETFTGILKESSILWTDLSDALADEFALEAVKRTIAGYDAVYASFRSTYLVERISRILKKTVKVLREQIRAGDFIPTHFELGFSKTDDLSSLRFQLSDQERMRFMGRIDRVDILEDQDRVYVKIIDYKSGKQKFDLAAIYKGEQLQLVVYLNAAMEMEQKAHPDKEVIPAGVLYYMLDDPLIDADGTESDEEIRKKVFSELKMRGLVNADASVFRRMDRDFTDRSQIIPVTVNKDGTPGKQSDVATQEEFRVISDYVNRIIPRMGKEILSGRIQATSGKCDFCPYASVCGISGVQDKNALSVSRDEILQKMREEL